MVRIFDITRALALVVLPVLGAPVEYPVGSISEQNSYFPSGPPANVTGMPVVFSARPSNIATATYHSFGEATFSRQGPAFPIPTNGSGPAGHHPHPTAASMPHFRHGNDVVGRAYPTGSGMPPFQLSGNEPSRPYPTGSAFPPFRHPGNESGHPHHNGSGFPPFGHPGNESSGHPNGSASPPFRYPGNESDAAGSPMSLVRRSTASQSGVPPFPINFHGNSSEPHPRPAGVSMPMCTGSPVTYIVAHLDTADGIAAKFNITVAALQAANAGKVLFWDLLDDGSELVIPQTTCSRHQPTGHPAPTSTGTRPVATSDMADTPTSSSNTVPSAGPSGRSQVIGRLVVTDFDKGSGASTPQVFYNQFKDDGSAEDSWPQMSDWLSWDAQFGSLKNGLGKRCANDTTPNTNAETEELGKNILSTAAQIHTDPRFLLAMKMQTSNGCIRGPEVDNAALASALTEAGGGSTSDPEAYYQAAKIYSFSSNSSSPAACYASDIANRLRGWSNGSSGRSPCKSG